MKRIAFGILMLAAGVAAGQLGLTMSSVGHGLVAVYYVVTGIDSTVTAYNR